MSIKKIIPFQLKCYVKYLLGNKECWKDYIDDVSNKKKVIVALAADYGNLGDVAITLAQEQFLQKIFPEAEIIDFPIAMTFTHMKSLKSIVNESDIITIVGGGNMGDLYPDIEYFRQFVIKQFPKNKIISFPQTIQFKNEKNLKKCVNVYSKHRNLTLVAREKYSFDIMKENFKKNNVILSPDIVLSMKPDIIDGEREGMLLIIRDDNEGILSSQERKKFIRVFVDEYKAHIIDTVIETPRMSVSTRKTKLAKILKQITSASVVVTNRLHGMIFCAITKTPCVVLPINGDKVKGVFEWINDLDYIKYCDSYDINIIKQLIQNIEKENINRSMIDLSFAEIESLFESCKKEYI